MILKCASLYWNGRITFLRQLAIVVTVRFRYQRYEHESSFVEVAAGVNFSCLCSYVSPRSYEHADVGVLKSDILCVTVTVAFRVHQISVMNSIICCVYLTLRMLRYRSCNGRGTRQQQKIQKSQISIDQR